MEREAEGGGSQGLREAMLTSARRRRMHHEVTLPRGTRTTTTRLQLSHIRLKVLERQRQILFGLENPGYEICFVLHLDSLFFLHYNYSGLNSIGNSTHTPTGFSPFIAGENLQVFASEVIHYHSIFISFNRYFVDVCKISLMIETQI